MFLVAQHAWSSWGIGEFAIAIIILCAVIGILYVAMRQFGIEIPAYIKTVFWIVICAIVCIVAIRFLLTL